jgi:hypothetical protein
LPIKSAVSEAPVFLITPPFSQFNTPYPATSYLKGFLNTKNIKSYQADLGIEVTLALFNKNGIEQLFAHFGNLSQVLSTNAERIIALKDDYINTMTACMGFPK